MQVENINKYERTKQTIIYKNNKYVYYTIKLRF